MLSTTQDLERNASADGRVRNEVRHGLVRRHRLPVDPDDHIALGEAGAAARSAWNNRADQFARILGNTERRGEVLVHRLQAHAQVAALRALAAHELVDDGLRGLGWDGESDSARS